MERLEWLGVLAKQLSSSAGATWSACLVSRRSRRFQAPPVQIKPLQPNIPLFSVASIHPATIRICMSPPRSTQLIFTKDLRFAVVINNRSWRADDRDRLAAHI